MTSKPNAEDGQAESELHSAAWAGDIEYAKQLISDGADINLLDSILEAPLHGAAAWGRVEMVSFLLSSGADPNLKNRDGDCPIHWACSHGNKKVVEILIKSGAKMEANGSGVSLLEIAKAFNMEETISWLGQNITRKL